MSVETYSPQETNEVSEKKPLSIGFVVVTRIFCLTGAKVYKINVQGIDEGNNGRSLDSFVLIADKAVAKSRIEDRPLLKRVECGRRPLSADSV